MIRLEITHPKPAPTQAEMRACVARENCLAGGSALDRIYGFRFASRIAAETAVAKLSAIYPLASIVLTPES